MQSNITHEDRTTKDNKKRKATQDNRTEDTKKQKATEDNNFCGLIACRVKDRLSMLATAVLKDGTINNLRKLSTEKKCNINSHLFDVYITFLNDENELITAKKYTNQDISQLNRKNVRFLIIDEHFINYWKLRFSRPDDREITGQDVEKWTHNNTVSLMEYTLTYLFVIRDFFEKDFMKYINDEEYLRKAMNGEIFSVEEMEKEWDQYNE